MVEPAVVTPAAASPNKPGRRRRLAIEIGLVVLAFVAIRLWNSHGVAAGPIPELALTAIDGEDASLGARPSGYVVHFFATWCGVCRAEEGNVAALADGHQVIAIASQSGTEEDVRAYVHEAGLGAAHVVLDPTGRLAARFGVRAFPTTFYVARDGTIRTSEVGYTSRLGMLLRTWWVE